MNSKVSTPFLGVYVLLWGFMTIIHLMNPVYLLVELSSKSIIRWLSLYMDVTSAECGRHTLGYRMSPLPQFHSYFVDCGYFAVTCSRCLVTKHTLFMEPFHASCLQKLIRPQIFPAGSFLFPLQSDDVATCFQLWFSEEVQSSRYQPAWDPDSNHC